MTKIWVISDTHFGHSNILNFKDDSGSCIRGSLFENIEQHDEALIKNWNNLVKPQDHVYHLGDVVLARRNLEIVKRLNGHKRLVRGNHDIFKTAEYQAVGFEEIYGVRVFPASPQRVGAILSHIPIHSDSLPRWGRNIHGHLHQNSVRLPDGSLDPRYICVSVEHTDYCPVPLDDLCLIKG